LQDLSLAVERPEAVRGFEELARERRLIEARRSDTEGV